MSSLGGGPSSTPSPWLWPLGGLIAVILSLLIFDGFAAGMLVTFSVVGASLGAAYAWLQSQ